MYVLVCDMTVEFAKFLEGPSSGPPSVDVPRDGRLGEGVVDV